MTERKEFKLLKKVLRKHKCLRAYRRFIRKGYNRSLIEDFRAYCSSNDRYLLVYFCNGDSFEGKSDIFWNNVARDFYNKQSQLRRQIQ